MTLNLECLPPDVMTEEEISYTFLPCATSVILSSSQNDLLPGSPGQVAELRSRPRSRRIGLTSGLEQINRDLLNSSPVE